MRRIALAVVLNGVLAGSAIAQSATEHPTGNRTTPPTLRDVQPKGIARGTTVELTLEGFNLAGAKRIHFDQPGIKGKVLRVKELPDLPDVRLGSNGTPSTIDLGPLPPRNQVTVEVDVSPEADIGAANFRLVTPLGTSPEGRILIEPYYGEAPDREPNNTLEGAFETYLPAILVGEISRPGDVDHYKIKVAAGEEVVFENGGALLGSSLQPVITILAEDQSVVKEFGADGDPMTSTFAHKFERAGTYYLRVSDYQQSGRNSHLYRIKAGKFVVANRVFPLGVEKNKAAAVELQGPRLTNVKLQVQGKPAHADANHLLLRPVVNGDRAFNELRLAVGDDPEVLSTGANRNGATAQSIKAPVTINGRIEASTDGVPVENYFRFRATKGNKYVFEVQARRFGSELDSFIEVLTDKGQPIERAVIRPVMETAITLRDHDSASRGLRLASYTGLEDGDWVMAGAELMRIEAMPLQPDADAVFDSFGGQRLAYLGTSSEAHAMDQPVYKVQIHPASSQFAPNGLPLTRLYYRNDDGGPGTGKDSYLEFVPPADGEYLVRIRDVRGLGGPEYAYRLNVRTPRPDFQLAVNPKNPNVPAGGSVPITVTALRKDGYDGPIEVSLQDLPPGITANAGVIRPGQVSTTLLLSAQSNAKLDDTFELKVSGQAAINGTRLVRMADPDDRLKLVTLMPPPDVSMHAKTREVVLEAGSTAEIEVAIQRQNGFGGRVPVEVRNLPPRVRIVNSGLNGVLINETETQRSFTIEALPSAEPGEQLIYVAGKVETRSNLDSSYAAPEAIRLRIVPAKSASSTKREPSASGAPRN
jgi:hypothetical protein